ncbi:MAG: hypothetical protein Kow00109_04140 [Acidobacteriota bacterium]
MNGGNRFATSGDDRRKNRSSRREARRKWLALAVVTALTPAFVGAGYKAREPQLKAPRDYPARQEFQGLVIAAEPFLSKKRIEKELFDTDKILEIGLFPLVLIIQNQNDFPVEINLEAVQLISPDGEILNSVPYEDVLFRLLQLERKIRPGYSPLPGRVKIAIQQCADPEMLDDFSRKAPPAKWVDPQTNDYCVVFFERVNDLKGFRVYIPELIHADEGTPLVFFEFELP